MHIGIAIQAALQVTRRPRPLDRAINLRNQRRPAISPDRRRPHHHPAQPLRTPHQILGLDPQRQRRPRLKHLIFGKAALAPIAICPFGKHPGPAGHHKNLAAPAQPSQQLRNKRMLRPQHQLRRPDNPFMPRNRRPDHAVILKRSRQRRPARRFHLRRPGRIPRKPGNRTLPAQPRHQMPPDIAGRPQNQCFPRRHCAPLVQL